MIDRKVVKLGESAMDPARLMEGLEIVATNRKIGDLCGVMLALADTTRNLVSDDLANQETQQKQMAAAALFLRDWFQSEGIEI